MEQLKETLAPLINLLPPEARAYWRALLAGAALVALLVALALCRWLFRALFGRRRRVREMDLGPRENLSDDPIPLEPAGRRRLTVEGLPVRLRLVVVAPLGKQAAVQEDEIAALLDQVLWGLGTIFQRDRPRVRLWPAQLSGHGFVASFQRCMQKPEAEGQPSRWILIAGQTPARPQPLLLGLALWGDVVNRIGRMNLEPGQWASVLRIQDLINDDVPPR